MECIYVVRKTITWCLCTPLSTAETFGEKFSAEACSGKEIYSRFPEEETDDEEYLKYVKSRISGFSRGQLEAGRNELGLCTAKYESKSCCSCVLKA